MRKIQLEAMNVGSIDIGLVGESPPIFAQAAGASLTYVVGTAASPAGSAILVPQNSQLQKLRNANLITCNSCIT